MWWPHINCGHGHSKDWDLQLNISQKVSWTLAYTSLCFFTGGATWPSRSSSCHQALLVMIDSTFELWTKINPIFLTLFLWYLITATGKVINTYLLKESVWRIFISLKKLRNILIRKPSFSGGSSCCVPCRLQAQVGLCYNILEFSDFNGTN